MSEKLSHGNKVNPGDASAATEKRAKTSSEQHFRVYENSRLLRIKRDIRILIYLAKLFYRWFSFGGRLRRAWRQADKSGQPFALDEIVRIGK